MKLESLRVHYDLAELRQENLSADPFKLFALWMKEACEAKLVEPNAMSLTMVGTDGRPASRTVLLNEFDERGFVFYTNLEGRKARQICTRTWKMEVGKSKGWRREKHLLRAAFISRPAVAHLSKPGPPGTVG